MRAAHRYHPAAKVDRGGAPRGQLSGEGSKPKPVPCRFREVGWSCECPSCDERITKAQLDAIHAQVAARLRGESTVGRITEVPRRQIVAGGSQPIR